MPMDDSWRVLAEEAVHMKLIEPESGQALLRSVM